MGWAKLCGATEHELREDKHWSTERGALLAGGARAAAVHRHLRGADGQKRRNPWWTINKEFRGILGDKPLTRKSWRIFRQ